MPARPAIVKAATRKRFVLALALLVTCGGIFALTRPSPVDPIVATVAVAPYSAPAFINTRDGVVFIGSSDLDPKTRTMVNARVLVLSTISGRVIRTVHVPQPIGSAMAEIEPAIPSAAATEDQGWAYLIGAANGPGGNSIVVLDARSGRFIKIISLPATNAVWLAVAARLHRLFVLDINYPLVIVSVYDARNLRHLIDTTVDSPAISANGWSLVSVPIVVDRYTNRVFASFAGSNGLGILDARDGSLLTTTALKPLSNVTRGSATINTPVLDERLGRVYASDLATGTVNTVDAATGRLLNSVVVGHPASIPIVDARTGHIFVLNPAGLSMLDARSGRLLATTSDKLEGYFAGAAVDARSGRVYLGLANGTSGTVSVIDGTSGRLLRTIAVSHPMGSVLVDDRHKRLLVFDNGGTAVVGSDPFGWVPGWLRRRIPFLPPFRPRYQTIPGSVTVYDSSRL